MSRGFVKEEDQEEAPFIPPRASLPPGITNYVTPEGLRMLTEEKRTLEEQRKKIHAGSDKENRHARAVIDGKLNLLQERISSARVLDPADQPAEEVRFGARVKLKVLGKNMIQEFQIVGVDEADVKKQKIAFIAPVARAVTGRKKGEIAEFKLGNELRRMEVLEINYKKE